MTSNTLNVRLGILYNTVITNTTTFLIIFSFPLIISSDILRLAITVGTWPYKDEPLKSVAEVVAAIEDEAKANNYEVQLLKKWEYRMVTLLYRVRRID